MNLSKPEKMVVNEILMSRIGRAALDHFNSDAIDAATETLISMGVIRKHFKYTFCYVFTTKYKGRFRKTQKGAGLSPMYGGDIEYISDKAQAESAYVWSLFIKYAGKTKKASRKSTIKEFKTVADTLLKAYERLTLK